MVMDGIIFFEGDVEVEFNFGQNKSFEVDFVFLEIVFDKVYYLIFLYVLFINVVLIILMVLG